MRRPVGDANKYLDGTVDASIGQELDQHRAGCNPSPVVVGNFRQTITLNKAGKPCELPAEFSDQLHDRLRKKWREKFPAK